MRKAFSLLTAIFIIVLMATVAGFVMSLSGKMVQSTTSQFMREQSVLLAKSYTEYAIMAVTANEHDNTTCLNNITGTYELYNINVDLSYIGNVDTNLTNCTRVLSTGVTEEKSPLNIIVDVSVSYADPNHPDDLNITYYKRTLQKI